MLLHELSLQSPSSVLNGLHTQPNLRELYHRWVTLPGIHFGEADAQQCARLQKQVQSGPRLMQLPHHFQVGNTIQAKQSLFHHALR